MMQKNYNSEILTVSDLTKEIKSYLEEKFSRVSVIGEISNFKPHNSGHWYFVFKDSGAVINCTMWKGFNQYVFFTPEDGMKIILNGKLSVYPPRGAYQIDVRSMKPAGVGELQEAFERLKKKLEGEGLFDEEHKKPIPTFPKRVAIVTALDGAAFKDMISVAERRFPIAEIVIVPARVQGAGSAQSVADGIKLLNKKKDIDVIITGRGGGSIEDLWAFNEEIVARAIFNSKIPIISGVGHEADFTIADYVADLRAPTPSVAMELATPNVEDTIAFLSNFFYNSTDSIIEKIENNREAVERILYSYGYKMLPDLVNRKSQQTDNVLSIILSKIEKILLLFDRKLSLLNKTLESHDIKGTLQKGFVLVQQNSKFVLRAAKFDKLAAAKLKFSDGDVDINSSSRRKA
jgi:exodeoxyribonuclease VII large subunit